MPIPRNKIYKEKVNPPLSQKHMVGCATEAIVLSMGKVPWANLDGTSAANVLHFRIGPNPKNKRIKMIQSLNKVLSLECWVSMLV
jgi:hypothetical protein